MCIRSVERQRVLDGGLRARSEIDVVETVAGVALSGDGDVLFDQCEIFLAEASSKAVVADLSDGD